MVYTCVFRLSLIGNGYYMGLFCARFRFAVINTCEYIICSVLFLAILYDFTAR